MQKTAYLSWLYNVTEGDALELSEIIKHHVIEDANPQAYDLLAATEDKAYTNETFTKAAKLVKNLFENVSES